VAEHQKSLQPALLLHGLEAQQRAEGFPGTGPGKHQDVLLTGMAAFEPASKQLNQLLLPLARLDGGVAELIRGDGDQNTSAELSL
jgi:hypothetical protein